MTQEEHINHLKKRGYKICHLSRNWFKQFGDYEVKVEVRSNKVIYSCTILDNDLTTMTCQYHKSIDSFEELSSKFAEFLKSI